MPVGEFICNLIIWDNLLSTIIKSLGITNYVNMDYIAVNIELLVMLAFLSYESLKLGNKLDMFTFLPNFCCTQK